MLGWHQEELRPIQAVKEEKVLLCGCCVYFSSSLETGMDLCCRVPCKQLSGTKADRRRPWTPLREDHLFLLLHFALSLNENREEMELLSWKKSVFFSFWAGSTMNPNVFQNISFLSSLEPLFLHYYCYSQVQREGLEGGGLLVECCHMCLLFDLLLLACYNHQKNSACGKVVCTPQPKAFSY